ncbi:MAG: hypothetical protein AB1391_02575 [Candidatus Micrarchaeota archaeon]
MDKLQLREAEIFRALKTLVKFEFVLIGGYATNAYTLPRFSVDCDIVIRRENIAAIGNILIGLGYSKAGYSKTADESTDLSHHSEFVRFEKEVAPEMHASIDVLIDEVYDRQSMISFDADWIFRNSSRRRISGKTVDKNVVVRVINPDALFVMKFVSARPTDIRDVFMMVDKVRNFGKVKKEISARIDFKQQFKKIKEKITDKQFRDNLQGVYGYIDENTFGKRMKQILGLCE